MVQSLSRPIFATSYTTAMFCIPSNKINLWSVIIPEIVKTRSAEHRRQRLNFAHENVDWDNEDLSRIPPMNRDTPFSR